MPERSVNSAVAALRRLATKATRDGMARFALPNEKAFGVAVGDIRSLGKQLGRDHTLAAGLWKTGLYEPRMLACFVEDPARVSPAQMDRWAKDFDNWGICDTACFHLFDRTPHAWGRIGVWADKPAEFVKRAAFALLASLTIHDKKSADAPFLHGLSLVEQAAEDERNFVKKAVNWALRSVGKRNTALHAAALDVAERLATQNDPTPRWVGKDALRELRGPGVARRLAKRHT
jgi:3-methyladenine DNA glycosylase AlkD